MHEGAPVTKQSAYAAAAGLVAAAALFVSATAQQPRASSGGSVTSFYDLKTNTLLGKPGNLAQYRGKVSLVVNVASKCGFTPQYEGTRETPARDDRQGLQRARVPEQRLRGPGARHGRGDCDVLQVDLRRDLPDVREARHEGGTGSVADLRFSQPVRTAAGLEFREIRDRQEGPDRRLFPQSGDTGRSPA